MVKKSNLYFDFENGNFKSSVSEKLFITEKKFQELKSIFSDPHDEKIKDEKVLYEVTAFINEENVEETLKDDSETKISAKVEQKFEVQENVAKAISSAIILFIIVMFLTKLRTQARTDI